MTPVLALAFLLSPIVQSDRSDTVFVPQSSVRLAEDIGFRAHTNHLIYKGPSLPRQQDPPFAMALSGPSAFQGSSPIYGYAPEDIRAAYDVSPIGGSGAIAVIDAYHFDSSLNDFNVFSKQFNLPSETSTDPTSSTNQKFQVVYQGTTRPTSNPSWGQEAALDIEWAHAMSPRAKIYLVEANSSSLNDLLDAVKVAAGLPGVQQISMSFSADEFTQESYFDPQFIVPGITFYAAAGDTAGLAGYPAMSPNVVAVGGTTLDLSTSDRVVSETVWSDTGGGLSKYEPIPSFQSKVAGVVGKVRGGPDVALVADPATGVAVYDSTPSEGKAGWMIFGGTSVATPCVAGIANASGRRLGNSRLELEHIYQGIGRNFREITSGSAGPYIATVGWDLCTGAGCPLRNSGV